MCDSDDDDVHTVEDARIAVAAVEELFAAAATLEQRQHYSAKLDRAKGQLGLLKAKAERALHEPSCFVSAVATRRPLPDGFILCRPPVNHLCRFHAPGGCVVDKHVQLPLQSVQDAEELADELADELELPITDEIVAVVRHDDPSFPPLPL